MRTRFLKLHTFVWATAILTVAWGSAPGSWSIYDRLAEGHIQRRKRHVNMAFGQNCSVWSGLPGALPQATVAVRPSAKRHAKSVHLQDIRTKLFVSARDF